MKTNVWNDYYERNIVRYETQFYTHTHSGYFLTISAFSRVQKNDCAPSFSPCKRRVFDLAFDDGRPGWPGGPRLINAPRNRRRYVRGTGDTAAVAVAAPPH